MKWRCTWCGREYEEHDPPCDTCGRETFERVDEDSGSAFEGESFMWVCENCGREHVKNAQICTSCSHPSLTKQPVGGEDLDEELRTPGYLAVGWPYLLGAVAIIVVVALVLAGVIQIPGVGPPAPPDAPGNGTEAAGLDLRTVETEIRGEFAAERGSERDRDDGLDALATYLVRHDVASRYDDSYDREFPGAGAFDPNCRTDLGGDVEDLDIDPASYDDEAALADAIAAALLERSSFRALVTGDAPSEAVAIHVTPDDTVTVAYAAC